MFSVSTSYWRGHTIYTSTSASPYHTHQYTNYLYYYYYVYYYYYLYYVYYYYCLYYYYYCLLPTLRSILCSVSVDHIVVDIL